MSEDSEKYLTVCKLQKCQPCDTTKLINEFVVEDVSSPIDQFIRATRFFNVLLASREPESINEPDKVAKLVEDLGAIVSDEELKGSKDEHGESITLEDADKQRIELGTESVAHANENSADKASHSQSDAQGSSQAAVPKSAEVTLQLNSLVLLGYISAVESYLRRLATRLVWVDSQIGKNVEDMKLSYGAALNHVPELLAEALMEDMTMISQKSIEALMRTIIGIESFPKNVTETLREYERICQLRHCIVHRFGKLGSKNAIALGLREHKKFVERPIQINTRQLDDIALNLSMMVKTINNFVYDAVLKRDARLTSKWTWNYTDDAPYFARFYNIFATLEDTEPSESANRAYDAFRDACFNSSLTTIEARRKSKLSAKQL